MALEFAWALPSTGDGEHLGTWMPERGPTLDLLRSLAETAERAGFDSLLVTVGAVNNHFGPDAPYVDPFVVAGAVLACTSRVRLLVALRIGTMTPATAARACATIDLLSGGRFMLNAVSGGRALEMYGETDDHRTRYDRTDEQLTILRGLWTEKRFTYIGRYYQVREAIVSPKPVQPGGPPVYLAGESEAAREVGARQAHTMLIPGTTLQAAADYVRDMRRRTAEYGRAIRVGTHFYVVARPTRAEALTAAEALLSSVDPRVGPTQRSSRPAFVESGLWTGFRHLWGEASLALVGSYREVADALSRFANAGLETIIVSSFPHVRECVRFAEHVIPLVGTVDCG